ncbi:MAG: PilZ domain-containing protein [Proteobacteria bacterium]|nr:PilZ domain-containing protein [Pseudomonadota bacterium]
MEERRRHQRLGIELPVILRHRGRIIPATALNISCGGMYIRADQQCISNNRPIEVIFDLSDKDRDVAMRGNITRVEESGTETGIGIRFTNLFSLSHKAIERFLKTRSN